MEVEISCAAWLYPLPPCLPHQGIPDSTTSGPYNLRIRDSAVELQTFSNHLLDGCGLVAYFGPTMALEIIIEYCSL